MEHAWSRIVAILLAAVVICVIPFMVHIQRQENVIQLGIMTYTVQFVDAVRNSGIMTKGMYQQYENQVRGLSQGLYITMVHTKICLQMDGGSVNRTEKICTESDILKILYETSQYEFQKGDFFRIQISKNNHDDVGRIFGIGIEENRSDDVYVYYGGSIRYETGAMVYRGVSWNDCVECGVWNEVQFAKPDGIYEILL